MTDGPFKFDFGAVRYIASKPGTPGTTERIDGNTITRHGTPPTPAQFEVTFTLADGIGLEDARIFTTAEIRVIMPARDLNTSYVDLERRAAIDMIFALEHLTETVRGKLLPPEGSQQDEDVTSPVNAASDPGSRQGPAGVE